MGVTLSDVVVASLDESGDIRGMIFQLAHASRSFCTGQSVCASPTATTLLKRVPQVQVLLEARISTRHFGF
ncbi:hypothetical protein HD593_000644 [Nonomuraea rubra]|uniref:Uncharacterized protein n=1 Tax=Nonomuraea rubra TaxID=46180 RepID=A0A7X0TW63_9ACTN|nr:hypothetical protein [Nonomuraea rubra]